MVVGGGGGVGIGVVEAEGVDEIVNVARLRGERVESSIPAEVEGLRPQRRNRRLSWKLSANKRHIKLKRALSHL